MASTVTYTFPSYEVLLNMASSEYGYDADWRLVASAAHRLASRSLSPKQVEDQVRQGIMAAFLSTGEEDRMFIDKTDKTTKIVERMTEIFKSIGSRPLVIHVTPNAPPKEDL